MKKRISDQQIISILREAEAGVSARELCRKHAISDATFYTWRKKYGGMEVPEVKRLKSLEEGKRKASAVCSHQASAGNVDVHLYRRTSKYGIPILAKRTS